MNGFEMTLTDLYLTFNLLPYYYVFMDQKWRKKVRHVSRYMKFMVNQPAVYN